jgi:hypothetical protein
MVMVMVIVIWNLSKWKMRKEDEVGIKMASNLADELLYEDRSSPAF